MRGNPLFAVVIPAKAGIQELPAKAGTSLNPGSSPGGFPRTSSGKNSYMAGGIIGASVGATGEWPFFLPFHHGVEGRILHVPTGCGIGWIPAFGGIPELAASP
jgi:hypothetical protein